MSMTISSAAQQLSSYFEDFHTIFCKLGAHRMAHGARRTMRYKGIRGGNPTCTYSTMRMELTAMADDRPDSDDGFPFRWGKEKNCKGQRIMGQSQSRLRAGSQ